MYWKYAARRVFYAIVMFVITVAIFSALFNAVAERVLRSQIREQVSAEVTSLGKTLIGQNRSEVLARVRVQRTAELTSMYHLDEPTLSRVFWRTVDSVSFRLGEATIIKSSAGEKDVLTIVGERLPRTIMLFSVAAAIDVVLGVWLGLRKARKAGGFMDKATSIGTMIVFGMPAWWLGMLLIMFFAFTLPIFPSGGIHAAPPPQGIGFFLDLLWHMVLPVFTLVILGFWGRAYITRNIVLGTLQEDFIMSARARGISERRVLFGHTLRTAAPPIVTMSLLAMVGSISGALIFEGIFSWPGMGNLYWQAVQQNDIPVLMGDLTITTGIYILALAVLDLVYGFLDPRVKVGGKA
ncbi:MAG: ABC transporter permease [Thermotogota bacterium]